jgi:hypothetical protein
MVEEIHLVARPSKPHASAHGTIGLANERQGRNARRPAGSFYPHQAPEIDLAEGEAGHNEHMPDAA